MAQVDYDFKSCLVIRKGISKKGNPYEVLDVRRADKFSSILIALARQEGVPTREFNTVQK